MALHKPASSEAANLRNSMNSNPFPPECSLRPYPALHLCHETNDILSVPFPPITGFASRTRPVITPIPHPRLDIC